MRCKHAADVIGLTTICRNSRAVLHYRNQYIRVTSCLHPHACPFYENADGKDDRTMQEFRDWQAIHEPQAMIPSHKIVPWYARPRNRQHIPLLIDFRDESSGLFVYLVKVLSYTKAEASVVAFGPVSDETFAERMQQCQGKYKDDGQLWCKNCGCGQRDRAALDERFRMPFVSCRRCGIKPAPGTGRDKLRGGPLGELTRIMTANLRGVFGRRRRKPD